RILGNLTLVAHGDVERPWVLEATVHHVDGRLERRTGRERQQAVEGRWGEKSNGRARAEQRLSERTVGAANARQIEAWDACVVEPGVETHHLPAVGVWIPGDPQ